MKSYSSIFSSEITDYLAIRTSIYREKTVIQSAAILKEFDDYLCSIDLNKMELTEQTVENWIRSLSGKTRTIGNKVSQLRLFCQYLQANGIIVYTPPTYKTRNEYIPYLFSDKECQDIFHAADNIVFSSNQTNPWIQLEFPVILRLLYSCGLRLGETISLQIQDIDFDGAFLNLLRTKNRKQRLVPLGASMYDILDRYCSVMNLKAKTNAYVFPGKTSDIPISPKSVRRQFDRIIQELKIEVPGRQLHERGPCMHCFRHTFAFQAFAKAERAGRPLDDSIPFLSTYLGHKSLNETEKYLKFSSTMYPEAMRSFEIYVEDVFPEVKYEEIV